MAEIYNIISIVAFSLAGVSLAFAIFCWIKFKIPKIIGALSGRTAKKSIEQMRAGNEKSGAKSYRPTPVAVNRGALTETIEQNEKTKKTATTKKNTATPAHDANATTLLIYGDGETELLNAGTELLQQPVMQNAAPKNIETFEILQDIVLIHTKEVI